MMKKTLSVLLAVLLLCAAFSLFTFAKDPETEILVPYKEAVIDGEVDGDEWDGATALVLNISDTQKWNGSGAGLVGDPDYAKKNHTDDDFTVTIKLMYKDGYIYLLETRKDTTPFYGSVDYHCSYQQDGSLCWFYNEAAWGDPEVISIFADSTSEKNAYHGQGGFLVYAPENNQPEAAILDGAVVKSTLNGNGHVLEAKIAISDIGLKETDLSGGKMHFTFCAVNIYNPDYSGNGGLWSPYGYQAQYTGVNVWAAAPTIKLVGGTYETEAPDTEKQGPDTEFHPETKVKETEPAATEAPETKAPETKTPAQPEKKGCGSAVGVGALLVLIAGAAISVKKH